MHDDEREGAQCEQPLPGADEARAGADARLQNGLCSDSQHGKLEGPLGISNGKYDLLRSSRKYFRYDLVVSSTVGAAYPARGAV